MKNIKEIQIIFSKYYKNSRGLFNRIFHRISSLISKNDDSLLQFKLKAGKVTFGLFLVWCLVLLLGVTFSLFATPEKLGQIGDSLNIVTSLTGVLTVGLLAYAVYLQRTELNAVKQQIEDQTRSTEKEQRKNRTHKMMDDLGDVSIADGKFEINHSHDKWIRDRDYLNFILESQRWQFVERIMVSSQDKEYLTYIDFNML